METPRPDPTLLRPQLGPCRASLLAPGLGLVKVSRLRELTGAPCNVPC